jgi:uncharacterized protein YPO0396
MSIKGTIAALLAAAQSGNARAQEEWDQERRERRLARAAWIKKTLADWHDALRQMEERCCATVDRLTEEEFTRLFEAEQAKVDAFLKPLRDAAEKDLWPRELYFGRI